MRALRRFWNWICRYRYEVCDDCGRRVAGCTGSWWHADDELWIEVAAPGFAPSPFEPRSVAPGVLCPPCFTRRCDAKGIQIFWHARVEYRDGQDVIEGQRAAGLRA